MNKTNKIRLCVPKSLIEIVKANLKREKLLGIFEIVDPSNTNGRSMLYFDMFDEGNGKTQYSIHATTLDFGEFKAAKIIAMHAIELFGTMLGYLEGENDEIEDNNACRIPNSISGAIKFVQG